MEKRSAQGRVYSVTRARSNKRLWLALGKPFLVGCNYRNLLVLLEQTFQSETELPV